MTKNAEQILEIVRTSTEHLSAEQIFLRLKETNKGVAMATVYNNLSYLYKEGFIRKISFEGYPDRYDNIRRHDHLVWEAVGYSAGGSDGAAPETGRGFDAFV